MTRSQATISRSTTLNKVYFISLKDDIGSDTNGDGTATTPTKVGWQNAEWEGVVVYGSGVLTMTHAYVLYGNNRLWGNVDHHQYAGLVLAENAHAVLTDSSVRYTMYGIKMGSPMATRLTLFDNYQGLTTGTSGGSYVVSMSDRIVRNNHIGLVFQGAGCTDATARAPWYSNLGSAQVDQLSVTAPVAGGYQLEIIGYTAAEFTLAVQITPAGDVRAGEFEIAGIDPAKGVHSTPLVPPNILPGDHYALTSPTTAQAENRIFLPAVQR